MASTVGTLDLGKSSNPWIENLSKNRPMRDNPDKRMNTSAPASPDRPDIDDKARAARDHMVTSETGAAKGGLIKKVSGKPVGKDHGKIPAQVGEFVMRTSAVKKYGHAKLAAVNAGKAVITVPKASKPAGKRK